MKLFLTLNKRNIAVITVALLALFLVLTRIYCTDITNIDGSTHESRIDYLKTVGVTAENELSAKQTIIPKEFSAVYEEYNLLQKQVGFDLSKHKAKPCTVYTYSLSGIDTKVAHLIVCNGKIIGGDISDLELSGNITPLY